MQQHILDPLGMRHSTAEEPVPARLAADQAASYDYVDRAYRRIPFTFDKLVPDGSISATANDLARFMIAHLQDGRLGDTRVLAESTARLMHQRSFAPDPRLDGYAHGFKERTLNGHRVIMHDGTWERFASAMLLVPDADLGVFVSTETRPEPSSLAKRALTRPSRCAFAVQRRVAGRRSSSAVRGRGARRRRSG